VWRQGIEAPFWCGTSGGPQFKNLRLFNMEFRPLAGLNHPHIYGGSTDIFEMSSVTISRGDSDGFRAFRTRINPGVPGNAARNIIRNVFVNGNRVQIEASDADLVISELHGSLTDGAGHLISAIATSGSKRVEISGCSFDIGFITSSDIIPLIELRASASSGAPKLYATINDVRINSASFNAALRVESSASASATPEVQVLVNALRFSTTYNSSTGYAVQTLDSTNGVARVVLSGCFFHTSTVRPYAAIQGTLVNTNSLRTLAGVDQRGWASLT
jgi:hypothetical protein